jgi:hypothetical protein
MKFTQIPENTFKELQMNAGISITRKTLLITWTGAAVQRKE